MSRAVRPSWPQAYEDFLDNTQVLIDGAIKNAQVDSALKGIFLTCIATHSLLRQIPKELDCDKLIEAAAGAAQRCATLSVIRQVSLTRVELRRMIECAIWYIYFVDHPVEYDALEAEPRRGYDHKSEKPIISAAHAEPGVFFKYGQERLLADKSGVGKKAIDDLRTQYNNLSGEVHAAVPAISSTGSLALASDRYDAPIAEKLRREVRENCSLVVQVVFCMRRELLERFIENDKKMLRWLIHDEEVSDKILQSDAFGIPRGEDNR